MATEAVRECGYWQMMAETTGTLWEHDKPSASCNHGFASHAVVVIRRDILGLREMNHQAKTITFTMPDNPLDHCRGSFPTADGQVVVGWKRGGKPEIVLPKGWQRLNESASSGDSGSGLLDHDWAAANPARHFHTRVAQSAGSEWVLAGEGPLTSAILLLTPPLSTASLPVFPSSPSR
jgi:hypothetical protein